MNRRRLSGVAVLLLLLGPAAIDISSARAGAQSRAADPGQSPSFRNLLQEDEYQRRAAEVLASLGSVNELERSRAPVVGMHIVKLARGSPLEQQGVVVGDVLESVNDHSGLWYSFPDRDRDRSIRVYDASTNEKRTVRVGPGRVGFWFRTIWRPELAYLRKPEDRGAWDRDVLVGIAACETDPQLAETAWHRAVRAGYSENPFSHQVAALIAHSEGRPQAAAVFAERALTGIDSAGVHINPVVLYRVALANNRPGMAATLVEKRSAWFEFSPQLIRYEIEQAQRDPARSGQTAPKELAADLYRDDLLPRSKGRSYFCIKRDFPALQQGRPVRLDITANHHRYFGFGPTFPVNDLQLRIRFTAKTNGTGVSDFHKEVAIGLDQDYTRIPTEESNQRPGSNLLSVTLRERLGLPPEKGAGVIIEHGTLPVNLQYYDEALRLDGDQVHDLQIHRVGPLAEMTLNGKRLLLWPTNDNVKHVSAFMHVVGMDVEVQSAEFFELIEKP